MRWHFMACGDRACRANDRYLVFQVLSETVRLSAGQWKVLARAHEPRELGECEGTRTAITSDWRT